MKKPLSKKSKGLLIALGVIALLGTCVICVSAYAKKLMNEPKFVVPEDEPPVSATPIPESDADKLLYVEKLFAGSFGKGNNISKKTEYSVDDETIISNAKDSDLAIIKYAKNQILGVSGETYDTLEKIEGNTVTAPNFAVIGGINECSFEQGRTEENGEIKDDDFYFFEFALSTESVENSTVFSLSADKEFLAYISESFSEMFKITNINTELTSCAVSGKADRIYDQLRQIKFARTYLVNAEIEFIGEYSALGKINIQFETTATDKYDFNWYGARFTDKTLYMNPEDEKTLPASVTVADGTEQNEFVLSFVSSDESIVSVSKEGIITAVKASDEPVEITMTLEYKGITFADTCLVTVTDLEVEE